MFDVTPGWHTTIHPFYYITGKLLSILSILLLVSFIAIKLFKIKKEQYQGLINKVNLIFCILSTVLLLFYFSELMIAWYSGYFYDQFSFFKTALGPYGLLYLSLMWLPLLLAQLFWWKKNRLNINLALFIIIMFNLQLWFEWIYIFVIRLIRN